MLQRIRHAAGAVDTGMLGGDVEIDETYIGGKEKNKHVSKRTRGTQGRSTKTKTVTFGMRERGGITKAFQVNGANSANIMPYVIGDVSLGTQIHADDNRGYSALDGYYALDRVNHSRGEYVRNDTHTNSIESLWALVKRRYIGIHHHWSHKHTQRYLDGFTFRLNHKDSNPSQRVFALISSGMSVRLPYKELVR